MGVFGRFKTPKYKHKDPEVRIGAVKELEDIEILENIAKNDADCRVCEEAIKKITNQTVLEDIAKNSPHYTSRIAAIKNPNLKNINILKIIATTDGQEYANGEDCYPVRVEAIKKIENNSVLQGIINNSYDEEFKINKDMGYKYRYPIQAAIEKIDNQKTLRNIALNTNSELIFKSVCMKITNESYLIEVLLNNNVRPSGINAARNTTRNRIFILVISQLKNRKCLEKLLDELNERNYADYYKEKIHKRLKELGYE